MLNLKTRIGQVYPITMDKLFAVNQAAPFVLFTMVAFSIVYYLAVIGNGVPFLTDGNESFSAWFHGRNLIEFSPWQNYFLTDDSSSWHAAAHPMTYTHQGNFPRFPAAILHLIGVRSIETQILIVALACISMTAYFLWKLSRSHGMRNFSVLLTVFILLDVIALTQWYGNLFRAWHMPLFFGCLYFAYAGRSKTAAFLLFFILFQFEFVFAIFVATAAPLIYLTGADRRERFPVAVAGAVGAITSVIVFISQLVLFVGWDGFVYDITMTYSARNAVDVGWETIREFYFTNHIVMWPSFPSTVTNLQSVVENMRVYGRISLGHLWTLATLSFGGAVLWALVLGVRSVLQPGTAKRLRPTSVVIIRILIPITFGLLFASALIPGYTSTAYIQRHNPMLGFVAASGLAVGVLLASEIALMFFNGIRSIPLPNNLVVFRSKLPTSLAVRRATITCLIGALVLVQSKYLYEKIHKQNMGLRVDVGKVLSESFAGKSFVTPTTYPSWIAYYTGSWAFYGPKTFAPGEDLDQTYNWSADRFVNPYYKTPEYSLCFEMPYVFGVDCQEVAEEMEELGHETAASGDRYTITKLNWDPSNTPNEKE